MAEPVTQGVPARAKLSHLRGEFSPSPNCFTQINRTLIELATNFLGVKNNDLALCYHGFPDDACHPFQDRNLCHIELLEFIPLARARNKRVCTAAVTRLGNETLEGAVNGSIAHLKSELASQRVIDEMVEP